MNSIQKKIIINTALVMLTFTSITSIILFIYGFVTKDDIMKLAGVISTCISPTTLIGIFIKIIINKKHLKAVDNRLYEAGINLSPKEQKQIKEIIREQPTQTFRYKHYLFIMKEDKIIIKFEKSAPNQIEEWELMRDAFLKFLEKTRNDVLK